MSATAIVLAAAEAAPSDPERAYALGRAVAPFLLAFALLIPLAIVLLAIISLRRRNVCPFGTIGLGLVGIVVVTTPLPAVWIANRLEFTSATLLGGAYAVAAFLAIGLGVAALSRIASSPEGLRGRLAGWSSAIAGALVLSLIAFVATGGLKQFLGGMLPELTPEYRAESREFHFEDAGIRIEALPRAWSMGDPPTYSPDLVVAYQHEATASVATIYAEMLPEGIDPKTVDVAKRTEELVVRTLPGVEEMETTSYELGGVPGALVRADFESRGRKGEQRVWAGIRGRRAYTIAMTSPVEASPPAQREAAFASLVETLVFVDPVENPG